jgi:hypothetical protein
VANSWVGVASEKLWRGFIRISRICLFLKPPREGDKLNEAQRRKAFKSFVLTLSDQQLVTGIAILVACFANWCRTTAYELSMVVSLAWFSSATHLATLDVLQDYFQRNRVVRNWRMIGMIAIMLLLIAGLTLSGIYSNVDTSAPLPCLTTVPQLVYDCNGTLYYDNGTSNSNDTQYINCTSHVTFDNYLSGDSLFSGFGALFTVAYLVYGYVGAITRTITISKKTALTPTHLSVYVAFKATKGKADISMELVNNAIIDIKAENDKALNRKFAKLSKRRFSAWLYEFYLALDAYHGSFVYHIGGLSFGLSYGLAQVATVRWGFEGPILETESNHIDFGQIVPLVLLVLPLLAAAEIFHGKYFPTTTSVR